METSLDSLCVGRRGVILRIHTDPWLKSRLRSLGLIPGTTVSCRYRTPCGKVTAVEFRGTVVALRTRDLRKIWVVPR